MQGNVRKAGDVLLELFRDKFGRDFEENARSNAGLFSSWEKITAEIWPPDEDGSNNAPVGFHSKIKSLERGVLIIEADHPGWVQILQTKKAELLSLVRRLYPELEIRSIALRLGRSNK